MHEIVHVRIHDQARGLDLDVTVQPTSTLAELLSAIDAIEPADRSSAVVWIDGAARNPATPVGEAGLRHGSTLSLARPPVDDEAPAVASLEQLAGASGADSTSLPVGRFDFSPADDTPTTDFRVSDISFSLDVATDGSLIVIPRDRPVVIGSRRIDEPTRLGHDVLNIGTARFAAGGAVEAPDPDQARLAVSTQRRMRAPELPAEHAPRLPLRWLALLPIAVGLGVIGLLVSPWLFVGATVALVAASVLVVREYRLERARHEASLERRGEAAADFERQLASTRQSIERALRTAQPPLVRLEANVSSDGDELFTRRIGDHDFGAITLAYGEQPWSLEVEATTPDPLYQWAVQANRHLTSVPIVASLADGPVGIVGRRNVAMACARAVVLEAAAHASTDELRLALAAPADRLDDWDWLKWLPHVDLSMGLATTDDEADAMVSSWRAPGHEWLQVVIVDQTDWFTDDRLLTTILGEPGAQCPIIVAPTVEQLPACAAVIVVDNDGLAEIQLGADRTSAVTPVGASGAYAEEFARAMARLTQPEFELHEHLPAEAVRRLRLRRPAARQPERPAERAPLVPPPIPTSGQAVPEQPSVDLTSQREQLS